MWIATWCQFRDLASKVWAIIGREYIIFTREKNEETETERERGREGRLGREENKIW